MSTGTKLHPQSNPSGVDYASQAPELNKQVLGTQGVLTTLVVQNSSAAIVYLFAFDTATGLTTDPKILPPIPVPIHGIATVEFQFGIPFTKGLLLAPSSTDTTFTSSAGTPCSYYAKFNRKL